MTELVSLETVILWRRNITDTWIQQQQIEQNLTFDFAMTGEDGKDIEPMFGPGLTGLKNLGNRYDFPSFVYQFPILKIYHV